MTRGTKTNAKKTAASRKAGLKKPIKASSVAATRIATNWGKLALNHNETLLLK
jgi:hypothetical protein